MIVKNLYLVTGIKHYDAYQGDSAQEYIKLLVPADDEDTAKKAAYETKMIDELTNVRLLYNVNFVLFGDNGNWEKTVGLDSDIIYSI